MASQHEIEIKFRIQDLRRLATLLKAAGFKLATRRTREINTLYDLSGQILGRRGQVLRLRNYGKDWILTHKEKGELGRHKKRVETETKIADGGQMHEILSALGFQPVFRYEKFRAEWTDGKGHVVIDETPIGNFGEVEGSPLWIDRTAEQLGILSGDYITESYPALFLAWKRSSNSAAKEMTFAALGRRSS